ncbi:hypothetical protein NDU88_005609 [Pleurodeles waltl]|uniref:Uncharacterized protein n=1 Tax=Pleurodeles waltl TaxID=8319 RepID=A0AAV7WY56_PLEWA|nr:hypothetical protein NDU88_005609 [Pleurodeles waltl]
MHLNQGHSRAMPSLTAISFRQLSQSQTQRKAESSQQHTRNPERALCTSLSVSGRGEDRDNGTTYHDSKQETPVWNTQTKSQALADNRSMALSDNASSVLTDNEDGVHTGNVTAAYQLEGRRRRTPGTRIGRAGRRKARGRLPGVFRWFRFRVKSARNQRAEASADQSGAQGTERSTRPPANRTGELLVLLAP